MTLFFTPVVNKDAFIKKWTDTKFTEEEARQIPNSTGIAILLKHSNIVAIDLDDVRWCVQKFSSVGVDILKELEGHFEIVSPKENRKKVLFQYPSGITLEYIKLPPKKQGCKLELRTGDRYDVWGGSQHPEGGMYTLSPTNTEIKPLPQILLNFWLDCMKYKSEEKKRSKGTGEVHLISSTGAMSVVYLFNVAHPLEKILEQCGYVKRGDKWKSPNSTSGSYGLTTQSSYLNPWDVCYSHHASDNELSGRPIDAFEIASAYSYPDVELYIAKLRFTKDQSNILQAVDAETGEVLSITVNQFNNPLGELQREFSSPEAEKMPAFPEDVMLAWPEPWPTIWRNWCKMPRVLSQELLLPTVLGVHAHMLGGSFITAYSRKPGFYFLTIAPSTAHKDGNSRDAIQNMTEALTKSGHTSLFFAQLLSYPTSITADTSFIEAFRLDGVDKGHLFWLNTEATRMFQKMSTSGNDNVSALADKIIEVVDGKSITGKQKVGQQQQGVANPNVQLLFYTQPETIQKYITEELVDSGLLGRATITLSPLKVQRSDMFMEPEKHYAEHLDKDLAVFYSSQVAPQAIETIKFSDHGQLDIMKKYHEEVLLPLSESNNDAMYKMISRLGNTAEQLYTVIVGVCHRWDDLNGSPRRNISVEPMLPLITYWAEVKRYVVVNYVQDRLDPLAHAVLEVIQELISGKLALSSVVDKRIRNENGMVPRSSIAVSVKNKPKLKSLLSSSNDNKNVTTRIYTIVDLLVKDGTLVEERFDGKKKPYIGILAT